MRRGWLKKPNMQEVQVESRSSGRAGAPWVIDAGRAEPSGSEGMVGGGGGTCSYMGAVRIRGGSMADPVLRAFADRGFALEDSVRTSISRKRCLDIS